MSLTATISPLPVSVSGITAADKVFDGNTTAVVDTSHAILSGLTGSDSVTVGATGTFSDAAVGTSKKVLLSSHYTGADAGNYVFSSQPDTLASIFAPASGPVTNLPPTGATPDTPLPQPSQLQYAVSQIQAGILPLQNVRQPNVTTTSSAMQISSVSASEDNVPQTEALPVASRRYTPNTMTGFPAPAPSLQIQNGGVRLPRALTSTPTDDHP